MAGPQAIEVSQWSVGRVRPDDFDRMNALKDRVFGLPEPGPAADKRAAEQVRSKRWWVDGEWPDPSRAEPEGVLLHLVHVDGEIVAVAQTSLRTMYAPARELSVLTLAGVMSDPSVRGRGYGRAVVLDAFRRVDEGEAPRCLFQTGEARGFYEKLNCVLVDNDFVDNTKAPPNPSPWSDDWVMRYPGDDPWPQGLIDLNGPGY